MFIGIILRRQQQGRRAIDVARRIAGLVEMLDFKVGVAAVDLLPESEATAHVEVGEAGQARLARCETLGGRFWPREFLAVSPVAAVWFLLRLDSLVEPVFLFRLFFSLLLFLPLFFPSFFLL